MDTNLLVWIIAASPIILFLIVILGFKWSGSRAGALSWLMTAFIAVFFFGADLPLIGYTYVKGFLLAIDVLYIIWAAIFLFLLTDKAGTIQQIGNWLSSLTSNRAAQGILLGWLFPSFLQGTGGFGVPVAVSAPLLVSAGFQPVQALVMASVGHAWGITFGSMASSYQALIAVTGFPGEALAPATAFLLGITAMVCGFMVCFIADGWRGIKSTIQYTLPLGLIIGGGQYLLAVNRLWIVSATVPSLVALVIGLTLLGNHHQKLNHENSKRISEKKLMIAFFPYALLVVFTLAVNMMSSINELLRRFSFTLMFPQITTRFGEITNAGPGRIIHVLIHPGTIIIVCATISFFVYWHIGLLSKDDFFLVIKNIARKSIDTTVAIFTMIGIATIMSHTRMTLILAEGIANAFNEQFFPVASPFIGALGAFITGNNTNSNVLFAGIQMRSAQLLGLSIPLVLASQTAGGAIGSMMAPAKIILGCATVGLDYQEGVVISRILLYGLLLILMIGLLTLLSASIS